MSVPDAYLQDEPYISRARQEVMELAGWGIYRLKLDGTVLFMDRAAREICELGETLGDAKTVVGKKMSELFTHPGPRALLRREVRKRGYVRDLEYPLKTLKGTEKKLLLDAFLVHDTDTGEETIQVLVRDGSEHLQTEELLRKHQKAIEAVRDLIVALDRNYVCLFANPAFLSYYCLTQDQVIGRTIWEVAGDDMFERAIRPHVDRCLEGEPVECETSYAFPKHGERHLAVSHYPLRGDNHEVTGVVAVMRDITEHKRAEDGLAQEQRFLDALMEVVPDAIYFKDTESRFIRVNKAEAERDGLEDPADAVGRTDFDLFTEEHAQEALADEQEIMKSGRPLIGKEEKETWRNGRETWVSTTKAPLYDEAGNIIGTFGISRDITDRKRAETELAASRQMLQNVLDTIPSGVFWKDQNSIFLGCNQAFAENAGLNSPEEVVGMSDFDMVWRDNAERYLLEDHQVVESGKPMLNIEQSHTATDGEEVHVRKNKIPLAKPDGSLVGILGTYEDITERKKAEKALALERQLIRALMETIPDPICLKDTEGRYIRVNRAEAEIEGLADPAEAVGRTDFDLFAKEKAQEWFADEQEILRTGQPLLGKEDKEIWLDGRVTWVSGTKAPLCDEAGNIIGIVGISRDITEHKRAEEALRKSQRELDIRNKIAQTFLTIPDDEMYGEVLEVVLQALESAHGVFGYMDENGALVVPSMTREVWDQCQVPDKTIVFPRETWGNSIWGRTVRDKKTLYSNKPSCVPKGHISISRVISTPIIQRKEVVGILVVANRDTDYDEKDIQLLENIAAHIGPILGARLERDRKERERNRAEETLRKYERAVEGSKDLIVAVDRNYVYLLANQAFLDYNCLTRDQVVGHTAGEVLGEEFFEKVLRSKLDCCLKGDSVQFETSRRYPEMGERFFQVSYHPLKGDREEVIGAVAVISDITKRKQAEERLRLLSSAVEQTREGIAVADKKGCLLFSNEAFAAMHGYACDELLGKHLSVFHTPDQMPAVEAANKQVLDVGEFSGEIWHARRDGSVFPGLMQSTRMLDDEGNLIGIIGTLRDVTDLKQAEQALRASEQEKTAILGSLQQSVIYLDGQLRVMWANKAASQAVGVSSGELVGRLCYEIWYHRHEPCADCAVVKALQSGQAERTEVASPHGKAWIVSANPVRDEHGGVTGVVEVVTDITEHKQAEAHVHALTQQLLTTQEAERRKIALDLHDNIAQNLSALKVGLGTLVDDETQVSSEVRKKISKLSQMVRESIASVRDLAYDLQPPGLEQLGLVHGTFRYCRDFSEKNELPIDFHSAGMDALELDGDVEITLFRLVQEALNNIRKHADARHATIKLTATFPNIILRIEDDGKGFDVQEELATALKEKRMGLWSMKERVGLLQGTMKIVSRLGKGTRISVEIPYKERGSGSRAKRFDRR